MSKTLVLGSCVCDMVVKVSHLPHAQEDINSKEVSMSLGGMAYNVYNINQLLNNDSIFGCPIGTGQFATMVKTMLSDKGYQPIAEISDEDNGVCICLVDDTKDRTFICQHGAEYLFNEEWYKNIDMADVSYIYVSGLEVEDRNGNELVSFLEKVNKPIFFAPGPRIKHIDKSLMTRMFKLNCLLHINEEEALSFTNSTNVEQAALKLYEKTNNVVVITLGAKGCLVYNQKTSYLEGYPSVVIDTIGAGDCHAGAILACLNHDVDIVEAARFANMVSSKVVSQKGADLTYENISDIMGKRPW